MGFPDVHPLTDFCLDEARSYGLMRRFSVFFYGQPASVTSCKTLCNFEPQIWQEIITSRDAESTCFAMKAQVRHVM